MFINNPGDIVGSQWGEKEPTVACLWRDNTLIDLNRYMEKGSEWRLYEGIAINDRGQILALGGNGTNLHAGFVLTPVSR